MVVTALDIISFITLALLLLMGIVLLGIKGKKRLSNNLLSGFLLANFLLIAYFLLTRHNIIYYYDIPIFYFLLAPQLFLYVRSLCIRNFQMRIFHIFHATPFLITLLYLLIRNSMFFKNQEIILPGAEYALHGFENMIFSIILTIQIVIYMVLSIRRILKYRLEIKSIYSSVENINLSWVLFILGAFSLMWLLDTSVTIIIYSGVENKLLYNIIFNSAMITNFLFAVFLVYKGLKQSDVINGLKSNPKYLSSKLTESEIEKYYQILLKYLKEHKPYLIPSITIKELSEKTNIPMRQLSQLINEKLNHNFYDFINKYRIEEAKRIIRENEDSKKTILEILYEVGYNSKSVFNTAFKKFTGTTQQNIKVLLSLDNWY